MSTDTTNTDVTPEPLTVRPPDMIMDAPERQAVERQREEENGITGYEASKDASESDEAAPAKKAKKK